ncbi:unnamed protein product [Nesidiocoris tenuis]|uniref:Uncharacterized protein n=1 Tax=Nesidiocoris tenuis TaxID=355587 RepID=A0A6H5GK19_9HEMI|nr:unnamed protein product [Nesidiocoris tenuis]
MALVEVSSPRNSGAKDGRTAKEKEKPEKNRPTCLKLIRDFSLLFMNTSSIHGFSQITTRKRHPIESILWIVAVAAAIWGTVTVNLSTWNRFQETPTVVSIERNYHDWNTSFPAIAICPTAKYWNKSFDEVLAKHPYVRDKEAFVEFFKGLVEGSYLTWNQTLKTPFYEVHPKDFWKIVYDISYKFTYNVSNSNMEYYNVLTMKMFMTDYGICYSYNSQAAVYNEREYWEKNKWEYYTNLPLFNGNPLDGDIFAQVMNMNTGYTMFLMDPYELPDVATKYIRATNNSYKTLDVTALSIASSDSIRDLTYNQRKCRFAEEAAGLETTPSYSYYSCRQECRMRLSKKLCGCVPYFYRPLDKYPVCNFDGIKCLMKHGERLHFLRGTNDKCDCLPLCSETTYVVSVDNTMDWNLGTNLKWGLVKYPKLRYKRDILFGLSDLIVAIGGTAGLFLGCSLLSFAEIFYFFTVRFAFYVWKHLSRSTYKQ